MKLKKIILENKFVFHAVVFLASLLILFSRRPDALLNSQFWAEDGKVWFAQAYSNGFLTSLMTPEAGYFQTLSRLTAGIGQFLPLLYVPLLFALVALTVKILFVSFLVSNRCANLVSSLPLRIVIGFIFLALPNSYETHANLTNAQWNLALLTCLIVLAEPSQRLFWKIFDFLIVALSSLSGPCCIFLLPVAAIIYWQKRNSWRLTLFFVLLGGAIIQLFSLSYLTGFYRPSKMELGATPELFFKIIGGQIFLASLIGQSRYSSINILYGWTPFLAIITTIVGCVPLAYAVWKGKLELKLYLLFAGLITLAALIFPAITSEEPQWRQLWLPFAANRYWLIPMFGFILSLIFTIFTAKKLFLRGFAFLLILILPLGIYKDWNYAPYKDFHFADEVKKFEAAPSGTEVKIPINPAWDMTLRKK